LLNSSTVRFIESTNAKVFTGGGSSGADVYATMVIGADFYTQTRIAGEAMKIIIKPLGSAGSADPLDQRSSVSSPTRRYPDSLASLLWIPGIVAGRESHYIPDVGCTVNLPRNTERSCGRRSSVHEPLFELPEGLRNDLLGTYARGQCGTGIKSHKG
jgi:hypothetical protein